MSTPDKQTLAEKYRPTTLDDVKGSEFSLRILRTLIETEKVPSCMLFSGPKGTGKTSVARIVNDMLNGGKGDSMTYIEIDAASNNGVENIRELQKALKYSHTGEWRIVVLDEAHALSQSAFNALLKSLEEPADKTVFILASTKPEAIPDTVRSRAMAFRFSSLSVPDIAYRLAYVVAEEGINLPDPRVIVRIAEVADGSLRGALVTLQQLALLDSPTVEDVNELSGNSVSTTDLMYAMISGSLANLEVETTIMFSKSYDVEKLLKDLLNTLKKFHDTSLIGSAQFLACMEVIWNMRRMQTGSTITARTQLEAGIFAMFVQNFWDGEEAHRSGEAIALTTEDVIRQAG